MSNSLSENKQNFQLFNYGYSGGGSIIILLYAVKQFYSSHIK